MSDPKIRRDFIHEVYITVLTTKVSMLLKLRQHPNLVQLLGATLSADHPLIGESFEA